MSWTAPGDIAAHLERLWKKGEILSATVTGKARFPCRIPLKGPSSRELAEQFDEVRRWIAGLRAAQRRGYRLEWREVNHRVLGRNAIPAGIWVESPADAAAVIGRKGELQRFIQLAEETEAELPGLLDWLARKPLKALKYSGEWTRLLLVVRWLADHPRPGIYLRQVDLPGVDSKFLEGRRGLLGELFDEVLPQGAVDREVRGAGGFCRRYGFRDKPVRVRFRILDPQCALLPGTDQDVTVTADDFAALRPPVRQVFVTENEVNFLAFPPVRESMVLFGGGYGVEALAAADWLSDCRLYYWGDIDTHGFAILSRLRGRFPGVRSLLMDRATLLAHRIYWEREPRQRNDDLPGLTDRERALYDDLRTNGLGEAVRLEQERIAFHWLRQALEERST